MSNSRYRGDNTSSGEVNRGDIPGESPRVNDFTDPIGSVNYTVYGEGGKARHAGNFYSNNPYLNDLKVAIDNQDKDALYERAIEWDADYYNLQEQRAYNEEVLEEQREYDSAVNAVGRQRAAGINVDIANGGSGSSVGSSSAQMGQVNIADQQAQTKFNNKYDNINNVFNGINTASNVLGTFVSGFSSIANTIAQFRMLPSQILLNEANAGLASAQAGEINELLSGKKRSMDLSNALQYVNLVGNLANMIKTDATDEEFAILAAQAGFEGEDATGLISTIKQAQQHPEFLANYKNSIVADRQAQAQMEVYTGEVFHNLVEEELQLKELQLDFDIMNQSIANKVQTFLKNSPDYAENLADMEILRVDNAAETMEITKDQLRRDLAAYQSGLDAIVSGVDTLKKRNEELDNISKKRMLHPVERLEYESNLLRIQQMQALGSQQVGNVYSIIREAQRQKFYLEANTNYSKSRGMSSSVLGTGLDDETIIYGQIGFGDVLSGVYTTQQLVQQWSNLIMQGASTVSQFYTGYRLGKVGNVPSSGTKPFSFDRQPAGGIPPIMGGNPPI